MMPMIIRGDQIQTNFQFRRPKTPPRLQMAEGRVRAWKREKGQASGSSHSDTDMGQMATTAISPAAESPSTSPQQPSSSHQ